MRTRQAGESALLLLDAVDLLERAGISYAVVGAMAAAMLSLSDEFGNRVNLLLGLRGLGPDAYARATVIPFQNSQLRVVGREDFVV